METSATVLSDEQFFADEAALVEAARSDDAAFSRLYDFYFPKIYGFIYKRTGRREDAEDIVSQVFLKAFANLEKYSYQGCSFRAWLYRLATNTLIDHYRKSGRRPETGLEAARNLPDMAPDQRMLLEKEEQSKLVKKTLDKLPEKYQRVLYFKYFAEWDYEETAAALAITVENTRVLTHRALKKFTTEMEKYNKSFDKQ